MNIIRVKDYKEMSQKAAHLIVGHIISKPNLVLGFATGSTPIGLYESLIDFYKKGIVSFKDVKSFNLDEYLGLDISHPQSYGYFMKKNLFDHIDIKKENWKIPSGRIGSSLDECARYEKLISDAGGIDLQILGIGRNGHIGFNEPDAKFESETHLVELDDQTIMDNSRFFNDIDEVPKKAISMGIKTIMKSKSIILLASGSSKADAVAGMINGEITPILPASVLQLHSNVKVIVDEDASEKI
jgi:glucosamine-6-phosphate deaminase